MLIHRLQRNYADGWMANGKKAEIVSNRPAFSVPVGSTDVEFSYHTPGLWLGISITLLTICAAVLLPKVRK
jgi:uncharacterized membrane protein YfhO